jgi:ketosteroid isomerase-like protein
MNSADREELVRRSVDAWNSDDWEEQLETIWSPDGAIVVPEGWPEAGEFRGWVAMVDQWRRLKGSWAEEQVEVVELESSGDRVLAQILWTMRGEASGAPLQVEGAMVCEARDDRLTKMTYFLDRGAARAEAER